MSNNRAPPFPHVIRGGAGQNRHVSDWGASAGAPASRVPVFSRSDGFGFGFGGGGERDRTDDLLLAKQALSQLSYTPKQAFGGSLDRPVTRCFWWAEEDLNLRPHAYQARALTN